jgi:hypothetical protein
MTRNIKTISLLAVLCLILAVPALAQPPNSIAWSGDVDNGATVCIQGHHVWLEHVTGKGVTNTSVVINADLPRDVPVIVRLDRVEGRGDVEIRQQPDADNDFTARVHIDDPQRGRGHYHFVLAW